LLSTDRDTETEPRWERGPPSRWQKSGPRTSMARGRMQSGDAINVVPTEPPARSPNGPKAPPHSTWMPDPTRLEKPAAQGSHPPKELAWFRARFRRGGSCYPSVCLSFIEEQAEEKRVCVVRP
jgi:hypothetical protein